MISFCSGLPRSGSTMLLNILQQHPDLYPTGTCPTTHLATAVRNVIAEGAEFAAMPEPTLRAAHLAFMRGGMEAWFSTLTDKPHVISKNRFWSEHITMLCSAFENPRMLVVIRDLRGIIASMDRILGERAHLNITVGPHRMELLPLEARLGVYLNNEAGMLARPLLYLPSMMEWGSRYPGMMHVVRFEDLVLNPEGTLRGACEFLGVEPHGFDLENIEQQQYVEHDAVYRALMTHQTRSRLDRVVPDWRSHLPEEAGEAIVNANPWFYETFYPEVLS